MNTIGYRYGRDEQDGDESRPMPDLHADVQEVFARRDLDVQRIRWELTRMGLAVSTPPDTVSADITVDIKGQVVTVTDTQHVNPGQAQVEQRRQDHAPQHRAPQL